VPKKLEAKTAWRCIKDHGTSKDFYYAGVLVWMPKNVKMDKVHWERKTEWDKK
jgi:hypothetical protein